ncbi:hypothetical protein EMPG_13994 [Blastomyces silverae]|uniref:Uncharacterized protein n=1 Tax=Blastomyces silverae TaxID=2060906 RepID=A0A0H1BHW7_9EURO|nr:hypothetical protein EMPG_13994 [Blastomyces silverae]
MAVSRTSLVVARREPDGLLAVMSSDGNAVIPENDRPKILYAAQNVNMLHEFESQ